jgi:hypothetical protein
MTTKGTIGHYLDLRQKRGQGSSRRAFGSAPFTADQYTANLGADRIQKQGHFHVLLANDSSEGKD